MATNNNSAGVPKDLQLSLLTRNQNRLKIDLNHNQKVTFAD